MIAAPLPLCLLLFLGIVLSSANIYSQAPQTLLVRSINQSSSSTTYGNTTTAAATITAAASTTAAASFHCDYRGQDPDGGIASPFCECGETEETQSWPLITPTAWLAQADIYSQCAYTAAPSCLSCTSMGYYQGKCVSMKDCNSKTESNSASTNGTNQISAGSSHASLSNIPSGGMSGLGNATTGPITAAPTGGSTCRNESQIGPYSNNTCVLQDQYCSLQGRGHALDGMRDVCVLWDNSCCGNNASAAENYWNEHLNAVTSNACFFSYSPECARSNPPGRMSAFAGLKDWMRGPQCFESNPVIAEDPNDAMVYSADEFLNVTCCGDDCQIVADRVDVYYWPDPGADTSCLSIVGNQTSYVPEKGATTDATGGLYWGCTVYGTSLGIMADQTSTVVRTATVTTVAGIQYKAYLVNPWDPSQCGNASATVSSKQNTTVQARGLPAAVHKRGHSLIITNSGVSTTVMGNYTFTSPSIYVNFQGLTAGDNCGSTSIPSTMIAFAPGELSTMTGQIGNPYATPQPFNPKDLPCPPYSIMSQNWYTPLPGVPYRPYFALPDKLRQIPDFKYCGGFFFSVFDPPHTLGPATAMVAPTTTVDPKSPSQAPKPSPNAQQPPQVTDPPVTTPQHDPQGSASGEGGQSPSVGASDPPQSQPIPPKTEAPVALEPASSLDPGPAVQDPADPPRGGDPVGNGQSHATDPPTNPSAAQAPAQDFNPANPNNESPAQMSIIHQALAPSSPAGLPAQPASNSPAINQDPSDPNDESSAQMSALHQALEPSPLAHPQTQPISGEPPTNQAGGPTVQPAVNQPSNPETGQGAAAAPDSSEVQGGNGVAIPQSGSSNPQDPSPDSSDPNAATGDQPLQPGSSDPQSANDTPKLPLENGLQSAEPAGSKGGENGPIAGEPALQRQGLPPTTIQLGPQANSPPTTIHIGSTSDSTPVVPESEGGPSQGTGAEPGMNPNNPSDPSASIANAPNASPVVTVAGNTLTITNPSAVPIAGTVLTPGGAAATVAGTPISLASGGNLIVGNGPSGPSSTVLTVAGHTFTANPTSFEIAGMPVKAGEPGATIAGTVVSLASQGQLIIGATPAVAGAAAADSVQPSIFTVGDQTFTANPTALAFAGTTLSAGGSGTIISGTPISLNTQGSVIIGTSTIPLQQTPAPSIITTEGQVFTLQNNGAIAVDGITLSNGSPATTINGTPLHLISSNLVIGTNSIPLPTAASPSPTIITTDQQTLTLQPNGLVLIDGLTLTAGNPATTIAGTLLSLASNGLIIGTDTIPLPALTPAPSTPSVITTDGVVFTEQSDGVVVVNGVTLTDGGLGTSISGTPVKLDSAGLEIGNVTVPLVVSASGLNGGTSGAVSADASSSISSSASGSPAVMSTSKAKKSDASSRGVSGLVWGLAIMMVMLMMGFLD